MTPIKAIQRKNKHNGRVEGNKLKIKCRIFWFIFLYEVIAYNIIII